MCHDWTGSRGRQWEAGRHSGVTQQAVKQGSLSNMISLFQDKSKQGCTVCRTLTSPSCIHQCMNRCTAWAQVINENSWVICICPGRLVVSPENRCWVLVIGLIPELPPDCPENSSFFSPQGLLRLYLQPFLSLCSCRCDVLLKVIAEILLYFSCILWPFSLAATCKMTVNSMQDHRIALYKHSKYGDIF